MNCRKVSNLLSAYIDGELAGVEQLAIRDHLKACCCCCEEYDALLCTKRLLSGLKMKQPADDLETRIRRSISLEGGRMRPSGIAESWWARLETWWAVLAYPQKLRYSAFLAASSVAFAAIVIIPGMLKKSDDLDLRLGSPMTAGVANTFVRNPYVPYVPVVQRRMPVDNLPTFHNPAENPPPAQGMPALIPVTADEPIGRGR